MKAFYTNKQGTQRGLYPGGPFRVLLGFTMYLILYWKWKTMAVWLQNGCQCVGCFPSWWCGWLEAVTAATQHHERIILHTVSPGRDQNSKIEVQFLLNAHCFCAILELKNGKLNHGNLGTICGWEIPIKTIHEEKMYTVATKEVGKMKLMNAVWGVKLALSHLFVEIWINTTFWELTRWSHKP